MFSRVSTQASSANATIAMYHQPNGGKLTQSSSPPATAALMRGSRATRTSPNRLTHAGTSRFAGVFPDDAALVVGSLVVGGGLVGDDWERVGVVARARPLAP